MKGRKNRDTGGRNDAETDMDTKNEARTNAKIIDDAAEERKRGGRTKKNVGGVAGAAPKANAGRAPRKSGGSCDSNPFSSARAGTAPKGHMVESEMD